ncbi:hypothetical protein COOONC_09089 [Cooperia oncophora]
MCSWNVDNLTQPVDGKELLSRQGKQLFLWNLNEDIEGPVARMNIAQEGFLKKIAWAENG